MFGVSHGAIQFMTYEEMKNKYNQYRQVPIDTKMVSGRATNAAQHLKIECAN